MSSATTPPATGYPAPKRKGSATVFIIIGIVVAAVLSLILILMALAIPAMQSTIRRGNETSAVASLRFLNEMESTYASNYPQNGFACSLTAMGGKAGAAAGPEAAQLIPDDLASGNKSGYTFTISNCTKTMVNNAAQITSYQITAVPNSVGRSGNRGFCTDENAQIRYDPKGGTNCTELLQ
jgi:type IV pilus assembly protein PilA